MKQFTLKHETRNAKHKTQNTKHGTFHRYLGTDGNATTQVGTPLYMAPEILKLGDGSVSESFAYKVRYVNRL